jgi:hypothetical protein
LQQQFFRRKGTSSLICIFLPLYHTDFLPSFPSLNLSELLSFDPAFVGLAVFEVDDHQPQPTGIASQLHRIEDLLSAPIDALVQDSDEVKQILEETKPQLPKVLQIKLWPTGHLPFY